MCDGVLTADCLAPGIHVTLIFSGVPCMGQGTYLGLTGAGTPCPE